MNDQQTLRDLYLDLMKRSLYNLLYGDVDNIVAHFLGRKTSDFATTARIIGHTMVNFSGLTDLRMALEDVIKQDVPGDVIETGVWRGGSSIYMRAILKAYDVTDRRVWVADSFQGVPPPNVEKYPQDEGVNLFVFPDLAVSLEEVRINFARYGLLDDQVRFLKGWFSETLPVAPISKLALMRLDGDLYESTMDALVNLYPKLSIGGYIFIDDYGAIEACRQAVTDFRTLHGIEDPIIVTDTSVVYWQRTAAGPHFEETIPQEPPELAELSTLRTDSNASLDERALMTLQKWFYKPASERQSWQKIENQIPSPAPAPKRLSSSAASKSESQAVDVQELYAEIGRLALEVRRLKQSAGKP